MLQFLGVFFCLLADLCGSLSTSFQKLAHRQGHFYDPRTQQKPRAQELTSHVCCRGYFILGLGVSIVGIVCDFISLLFIGTSLIGVLGCLGIPINIIVNRILLYEEIKWRETMYIIIITLGCFLSVVSSEQQLPIEIFRRFALMETAYILMGVWIVSAIILLTIILYSKDNIELVGYSILSGIMGAQSMSMGKYLTGLINLLQENESFPPLLQIISVVFIIIVAIPLHILFLNLALKKYNATHAVTIFQASWCINNVVMGILIFGDTDSFNTIQIVTFIFGMFIAFFGVIGLSRQMKA